MTDGKITFATLVATPTKTSWSQAYTAGKLYAVLSLEQESPHRDLAATGKEIINALVEEYFTLEQKNLDTIKTAVTQTSKKIPHGVTASFVVVSLVDTIVYAYSFGSGKILLKRHDRVGPILKSYPPEEEPIVHAVSGYVEHNDTLILETQQFSDIIQNSDFEPHFTTPADAVEILSPKVHGTEQGGASAIVLLYAKEDHPESLAFAPDAFEEKKTEEEIIEEVKSPLEEEVIQKHKDQEAEIKKPKKKFSLPKISIHIPGKFFLFLLIPILILSALGFGLYTARQKQEESKIQKLFDDVYPAAEKQYNEGESLLTLNKQLALDDFTKAKAIIDKNINSFPKDSPQRAKMEDLLKKVEGQGVSDENTPQTALAATAVDSSKSQLLDARIKNSSASYVTAADGTIYLGSKELIETSTGKTIVENTNEWKTLAGIGSFNTNMYVLDKGNDQILKYVGGSKDSKSVYASGSFSKAISIAIDSSIYVLSTTGSIDKYTKGSKDTFSVTGLPTPLNGAIRIFTNADTTSVYVLDTGNKRVVQFGKTGSFEKEYVSDVIKTASDFDIHEKDKKIYILSAGKVYEIAMP